MKTEHTPEPWSLGEDNDGWYVEKDGLQIAHGLTEEDARRIVACVNACAGMTNEQIDNVCMISGSLLNRFGEHEKASQNWEGMDGATAWHLIDRYADGWADVGRMMQECLMRIHSNSSATDTLKKSR